MSEPSSNRVTELLLAAQRLPPERRAEFLETACGPDMALLRQVAELLEHAAAAAREGFLEQPALRVGLRHESFEDPWIGTVVGPYKIEALVGSGGMGRVYRARRIEGYERQVAVKIASEQLGDDSLLRRFRDEVRFQARVSQHPNIVGLLDAGQTTTGWPYLVTEFIEGEPIDAYCRGRRLGLRDRLTLFLKVSRAVAFAHSQLVLHRDLKPSNVQVTADGEPHLLDFGIAKQLDPDEVATLTKHPALTPQYASPEQYRGQDLDTASDVYSLAVVLYELLTGSRPYDLSGQSETERQRLICELDPPPPSRRLEAVMAAGGEGSAPSRDISRRSLAGDLDAIVMKGLEKRREDRYRSVDALAQDIENYLSGRPVTATHRTAWYLTRKFVRRHRWAVAAAGLALLAVAVATAGLTYGLAVTQRERAEALRSFQFAEQTVMDFQTKVAEEQLFDERQMQPLRQRLLEQAASYYEGLSAQLRSEPRRRREMSIVRHGLGMACLLQGQQDRALQEFTAALKLRRELVAESPGDRDYRRELAISLGMLARMARIAGDIPQAEKQLGEARRILETLSAEDPRDDRAKSDLVKLYSQWELMLLAEGRAEEAQSFLQLEKELCTQLLRAHPEKEDYQADFVVHCINAADIHSRLGDMATAVAVTEAARPVVAAALKKEPGKLVWLKRSATIENNLAQLREEQGDDEAARKAFANAVEIGRQAVAGNPLDPLRSDLADTLTNLADLQFDAGQGVLARSALQEARGLWDAQLAADPSGPQASFERMRVDRRLAALSAADGAWQDAHGMLTMLAGQWREFAQKRSAALRHPPIKRERILAGIDLARAQLRTGESELALTTLTEQQAGVQELSRGQPGGSEADVTAGAWYAVQSEYLAAVGKTAEEIEALQQAVSHLQRAAKTRPLKRRAQAELRRLETRLEELQRAKR